MSTYGLGEIDAWLTPVRHLMSPDHYVVFVRRVRRADLHADWRPILADVLGMSDADAMQAARRTT